MVDEEGVKVFFVKRCFVHFKDTKDNSIVTDESEWTSFVILLPLLNKYEFYEQHVFKDFISFA